MDIFEESQKFRIPKTMEAIGCGFLTEPGMRIMFIDRMWVYEGENSERGWPIIRLIDSPVENA